jgi:hypothetical protein
MKNTIEELGHRADVFLSADSVPAHKRRVSSADQNRDAMFTFYVPRAIRDDTLSPIVVRTESS